MRDNSGIWTIVGILVIILIVALLMGWVQV